MRFIQRLGTPCCPIPSKEHFTTLLILTKMLGDFSIDLKFFHSNNGLNWIEGLDSNAQTKAIILANDEYLFLMNITENNIYSSPADPIPNNLDIEEYLSLLKNYSSIEYYYPIETLSLVGLEVYNQAIIVEGDVLIFKDEQCTVYATGAEQTIYVRLNNAVGFGEGWSTGSIEDPGGLITINTPTEDNPTDSYDIILWIDWSSNAFTQPFTAGQVVECESTLPFEPVENPTTIFSKPEPEPDYKNIVGSYVYSDGTLGSAVKEGIVGVVAIPANACPDDKARIVPISGATSNLKWANDDYADMSALEGLGVSADDSFPYINNGWTITNTVQGTAYFSSNDLYGPMFWIEPTPGLLAAWESSGIDVDQSEQTDFLYTATLKGDYDENSYKVLPLPYLADGTPNPYIKTMNGWNEGISNATKLAGKSPLFDFASAFSKEGIPAGNWFIPSFPELIMLFGKYATIYNAISAANGDVSWLVVAANVYRYLWCSQCIGAPFAPDDTAACAWYGGIHSRRGAHFYDLTVRKAGANYFGVPMAKLTTPVDPTAIDLGLPSGLLWCNHNVGATNIEDAGLYFSWGNTEGHAEGSGYNFDSTTYNGTAAASISTNLSLSQDAAHANLGGDWRMPTKEETKELYDNTDREWTTINGMNGLKFMKKSDHSVFIFFPAAGFYNGTSLSSRGSRGYYWYASFYDRSGAYNLYFNSSDVSPQYSSNRFCGFSVRAVQNTSV